ncbi:MAG: type II toxin-antitoxin system RelE/ParE family toxin [Chloroflexota bacterium]
MSWRVEYYEDETGHRYAKEEIARVPKKARAKLLRFIDLLEEEGPIDMGGDYTAHVKDDIWELRVDFSSDSYRVLYFTVVDRTVVLLREFLKKTQKTPPSEISVAKRRRDDYLRMRHTP